MPKTIYFTSFFFLLFNVAFSLHDPVVQTKYGTIIGSNLNTSSGQTIEFFGGIPYAKPPVGELRLEVS